jgi:hypothetical protein
MGGWCEGRCQEAGGEKLEKCCKEQGQLAEASKEGPGSEWADVPMMMIMMIVPLHSQFQFQFIINSVKSIQGTAFGCRTVHIVTITVCS